MSNPTFPDVSAFQGTKMFASDTRSARAALESNPVLTVWERDVVREACRVMDAFGPAEPMSSLDVRATPQQLRDAREVADALAPDAASPAHQLLAQLDPSLRAMPGEPRVACHLEYQSDGTDRRIVVTIQLASSAESIVIARALP